jgi:hypothetical protein
MKNVLFITDMDEVLTCIGPVWYSGILEKREIFEPYFDLNKIKNPNDILKRDIYYMDKYLRKEGVTEIPYEVLDVYYDIYKDTNFYSKCELTNFGKSLVLLSKQSFCEGIVVVSHCIPGTEDSKKRWLAEKFERSSKVTVEFIPSNIPKSEVIKDYPEYSCYAEDRIDIIKEVIINTKLEGKEFYIPKLGYNKITDDLVTIAGLASCEIKTFEI